MKIEIKYLPKKESLRAQVKPLVEAIVECEMGRHDMYEFDWLDDYTKAELVLMGLCIGSNVTSLACGSIANDNAHQSKEREEFTTDLHQWFVGSKSKTGHVQQNAKRCLKAGDYRTVFIQLNEMSGIWAICAAMLIACEMPDHVPRLIDEVTQAMEYGYEETCF